MRQPVVDRMIILNEKPQVGWNFWTSTGALADARLGSNFGKINSGEMLDCWIPSLSFQDELFRYFDVSESLSFFRYLFGMATTLADLGICKKKMGFLSQLAPCARSAFYGNGSQRFLRDSGEWRLCSCLLPQWMAEGVRLAPGDVKNLG